MLLTEETRSFFDGTGATLVARAPGRLDVMGGIADYSGSLVLQSTIAAETHVAVQARPGGLLRVWTIGAEAEQLSHPSVELPLSLFFDAQGQPHPAVQVQRDLATRHARWAGYVAGCLYILVAEGILSYDPRAEVLIPTRPVASTAHPATMLEGANMLVDSTVPLGAGVSSSASLEVATMQAISSLLGLQLDAMAMARLCQMVEHRVVGAACGIMDQVACMLGRQNHLLALRCQPHELEGFVRVPASATLLGIDSGVKHSTGADRYTRTRVAAFMGRAIIRHARHEQRESGPDYLCAITPHEYRARYRAFLPDTIGGADFLEQYGSHEDASTAVEPDVVYAVRGCTEHPIYENARVERFSNILGRAGHAQDRMRRRQHLTSAGGLMYDSHHSYSSRAGLGAPETDLIVRMVRRRGPGAGLYGARITGGGSGGAVAVLVDDTPVAASAIAEILEEYRHSTGIVPRLISGDSPGSYGSAITSLASSEEQGLRKEA